LILMGVWRDPRCGRSHQPKKRARYEHGSWMRPTKDVGSWRCQKNNLRLLTTGRLMGVTVISSRAKNHRVISRQSMHRQGEQGIAKAKCYAFTAA
jgi:hypothetical protein